MSHYSHQEAPAVSYPPAVTAYPPPVSAPPPMGYPTRDGPAGYPQQNVPEKITTTSRGDFLKGCCAALCCCCALDICF